MAFPAYTPSALDVKNYVSRIIYAREVADYDGSALATPDNFTQLAYLHEDAFELTPTWTEETGTYGDGDTYSLGEKREENATITFANRRKVVMQDYAENIRGGIYQFLVELTATAINEKYQLLTFMGKLIQPPSTTKSEVAPFEFRLGAASAAISIDLFAEQDTNSRLQNLAVTVPSGTSITQAKGEFKGMVEIDWP